MTAAYWMQWDREELDERNYAEPYDAEDDDNLTCCEDIDKEQPGDEHEDTYKALGLSRSDFI